MRQAMADATVGDDVYGEDPTVRKLEELAAAKTGKEAGIFVASGTMGNLVGILSHAGRGDGAILGADAHVFRSEAGGLSALAGVVPQPLTTDAEGRMDLLAIEQAASLNDPHYPRSKLILLENSYGAKNGYPIGIDYFQGVKEIADRHRLAIHLDGARLFNAAAALGIGAEQIAKYVDSVTFCLSKGLCAPVGSVICGSANFAQEARRARKLVGGGMRQAGIIAAAGICALNEMVDRLPEDHRHAQILAEGLANIPGIIIDQASIKTNIVFFHLHDEIKANSKEIVDRLYDRHDILVETSSPRTFRAVTHYWVGAREVELLLNGLDNILAGWRS